MITMDYRGRGQSDYDSDFINYNILREGLDATELLDHLEVDKVTLLGTSRGRLIAMALAASHPMRLAGVILNDVGPAVEPADTAKIKDYVGNQPTVKCYDEAARSLRQCMEPLFPGVPLQTWRRQVEHQYLQSETGLNLRHDSTLRDALIQQAAAGPVPDLWPWFEVLHEIPTGVIQCAISDVFGAQTLQEMHTRHSRLISTEIADRGHVSFLFEPQSLDVIRKVLDMA